MKNAGVSVSSTLLILVTLLAAARGFEVFFGRPSGEYPPPRGEYPPPPVPDEGKSRSDAYKFQCPGSGRYGLKVPKKANCAKYYECGATGFPPATIMECPPNTKFNRLSRTCLDEEYVYCKWCIKEGRHEDITSSKHFIECLPGSVAVRYKCREGNYDSKKRVCKEKAWKIMDITVDAEIDMHQDIIQFQTDWKDALEEGDESSIEQFEETTGNSDKTKEKDGTDKESKKKRKKGTKPSSEANKKKEQKNNKDSEY